MKNTLLFDLDGTLLDTLTDLTASVNYALGKAGLPPRTSDEVRSFLGDGYVVLMERACGEHKDKAAQTLAHFTEYYAEHLEDNTKPYPGVVDALRVLAEKGRKMAIVSNKGYDAVQVLCSRFFAPYVTEYYGVREDLRKKQGFDFTNADFIYDEGKSKALKWFAGWMIAIVVIAARDSLRLRRAWSLLAEVTSLVTMSR